MDLLIRNVTAVTMDDEKPIINNAYIGITGGKISYLSEHAPKAPAKETIDGGGKLCMPGLVNAHTHLAMTLMRGYADDYALRDWLFDHVFPIERKLTGKDVYLGSILGMAELIATGTISATDMYMFIPEVALAAYDAGIYANISNGATSFDESEYDFSNDLVTSQMEEMLKTWHNADSGRVRLDVSVHGEYTSFPKLWRANAEYAQKHGLNMHVHLSETRGEHEECVARWGKTPAAVLAENGVFDTRATAAHCVYVTDEDIELLVRKEVTAVHNPISNLKLASGIARVRDMLSKGMHVAIGTDGVCSNNSHDLFEEIKLAALLQKNLTGDPTVLPAYEVLKLATRGGAFAQGREQHIGMLRKGYDASLILIDTSRPGLTPMHGPASALCYSVQGGDVYLTMVRGKVLYRNGEFTSLDLERLRAQAKPTFARLFGGVMA